MMDASVEQDWVSSIETMLAALDAAEDLTERERAIRNEFMRLLEEAGR